MYVISEAIRHFDLTVLLIRSHEIWFWCLVSGAAGPLCSLQSAVLITTVDSFEVWRSLKEQSVAQRQSGRSEVFPTG